MAAYVLTGEAAFDRRRTGDRRGAGRTAPATVHEGETMRRHLTASAACLLAMSMLCGCLMDGTIDKSGGGTLTVRQRLAGKEQFEQAKKRLQSADVTMTDASVGDDKWATFQVKFADVSKLSTTAFFEHTKFTLNDDEGGTKTLTVKYVNPSHTKLPDEMVAYFGSTVTIVLHLPAEVVKSNAAKTSGSSVEWSYPFAAFADLHELTLNVTYKRPSP
jgi:hypothetical protein